MLLNGCELNLKKKIYTEDNEKISRHITRSDKQKFCSKEGEHFFADVTTSSGNKDCNKAGGCN